VSSVIPEELLVERTVRKSEVVLKVQAELDFLPVATSFVEKAALAFGLGEAEALALTLATEEVFVYLCHGAGPGADFQVICRSRGYFVEEDFQFEAEHFDMSVFNITSSVCVTQEGVPAETGLLLASRMVDRFRLFRKEDLLHLIVVKEKSYPTSMDTRIPEAIPLRELTIRTPEPEELPLLVRMINRHYVSPSVPPSFVFPGKVSDMAACGDYHAAVAVDSAGHLGGGIFWRWEAHRLVELFGPYVLNQPPESAVAGSLVDHCLNAIARTRALGLINRYPTPDLPSESFEPLGSLTFQRPDGGQADIVAAYRHLEEDAGLTVWAHPLLEEFLQREFARLFFAREINLVQDEGEKSSPYTVLSAEFDRNAARATLQPVWFGEDSRDALVCHVETLLQEDIPNIFFEMDLGVPWQPRFSPGLVESGFEPRLVLPYAGRGDIVVFQYKAV